MSAGRPWCTCWNPGSFPTTSPVSTGESRGHPSMPSSPDEPTNVGLRWIRWLRLRIRLRRMSSWKPGEPPCPPRRLCVFVPRRLLDLPRLTDRGRARLNAVTACASRPRSCRTSPTAERRTTHLEPCRPTRSGARLRSTRNPRREGVSASHSHPVRRSPPIVRPRPAGPALLHHRSSTKNRRRHGTSKVIPTSVVDRSAGPSPSKGGDLMFRCIVQSVQNG